MQNAVRENTMSRLATLARLAVVLGFVGCAASTVVPATAQEAIAGRASVIDGDTIEVRGIRIRLFGIDAPESSQSCEDGQGRSYRCGKVAAEALDNRLLGKVVSCEPRDQDRYGRVVAVCREGGIDLNRWMVSQGLAPAYTKYGNDYARDEAEARQAKRGVWAGHFETPSDYRQANRGGNGGYQGYRANGGYQGYGGGYGGGYASQRGYDVGGFGGFNRY